MARVRAKTRHEFFNRVRLVAGGMERGDKFEVHVRFATITLSMITLLEGTVELVGEKYAVVKTGGVGYRVYMTSSALEKLPERGYQVKVWTHHYVREDTAALYGFLAHAELALFEMLLSVSGIGPKGALGILAMGSVDTLKKAIAAGDASYLTRVSGIGRKIAEKIILELREKMAGRGVSVDAPELKGEADALDALLSLGYSQREAREALAKVSGRASGAEEKVREALKLLGRSRR